MKQRAAVSVLFAIMLSATPAPAADGQIKLAQLPGTALPIVLSQPGSYVLTSDIVVTDPAGRGVEITANDVTLDLNGHTLKGPQSGSGSGIYGRNVYSVTVRNGRVWGFGNSGVSLYADAANPSYRRSGHIVENIQAPNNGVGILVAGGLILRCTASGNSGAGIVIANGVVADCAANDNNETGGGNAGIVAEAGSIVTNCTARLNGAYGIAATTDGKSFIHHNTASGNAYGQISCPTGNTCAENATF